MSQDETYCQWILYGNPSDFRDKFVIREVRITYSGLKEEARIVHQPKPKVFDTEDEAKAWGYQNLEGVYVGRMTGDDPVIIGVWV